MGRLDLGGKEPLYLQLANIFRRRILSGDLRLGEKIPTGIEIARVYQVSLITVKKALAELVNERLIFRKPKIGTTVSYFREKHFGHKRILNCLKISHLPYTEEVDEKIKQIFESENKNWELKFHIISESHSIQVLEEIKNVDLLVFNPFWFKKTYQFNLLVDLTKHLKSSRIISKNTYFEKALSPFEINKKIYALPQNFNLTMLYCNKKVFKNKGLDPLNTNRDWGSFQKTAKKLTNRSIWGLGYFPYPGTLWENFVLQAGGKLFNPDYTRFLIDTPEFLTALSFLKELIGEKKFGININTNKVFTLLRNNQVGMVMCGPFFNKILGERIEDWVVLPLPKGNFSATSAGSYGVGMTSFCKTPEIGWRFMELYCGEIGQSLLGRTFHVMPSLKKTAHEKFVKLDIPLENKGSFLDAAEFASPLPFVLYSHWGTIITAEVERLVLKKGDYKKVKYLKNKVENEILPRIFE